MEFFKSKKGKIVVAIAVGIGALIVYFQIQKEPEESFYEAEGPVDAVEDTEEIVEENVKIKVHIAGYVVNEGIVEVEENARIQDVIEAAGGLTEDADLRDVNLAYKVSDGQKIYIPNKQEAQAEEVVIVSTENGGKAAEKVKEKVNINTATQTELETLSGIGPSTALKIIQYRKENGKFQNIEEIKNVPGIGEAKFDQIREEIIVGRE